MPFLQKAIAIIIGSLILSLGINLFLVPFKVLDGGMIGVGLIIKYLIGMKVGLIMITLSIPIFLMAWFYNRSYFYNSLHGLLFSSFAIDILHPLQGVFRKEFQIPAIISAILGGILVGMGIGIMLRKETSTGGTDLIAQFLSPIFKVNVGLLIFFIDALIICIGGLLISRETFYLSAVTVMFVGITTSLCTWRVVKI